MPRTLLIILFSLCLTTGGISNPVAHASGNDTCLEIAGQPVFGGKCMNGRYRVTLLYHNKVIDTASLAANDAFNFHLLRNTIYAIRVEKEGFLPRLISINTNMPAETGEQDEYLFLFEVQMFRAELQNLADDDDVDFPVAVITFDKNCNRYDYSRDYTQAALQRLSAIRNEAEKLTHNDRTNDLHPGRKLNQ